MTELEELDAAWKSAHVAARVATAAAEAAEAHSSDAFWTYIVAKRAFEAERAKQKENK
jgi:hypothetical protein